MAAMTNDIQVTGASGDIVILTCNGTRVHYEQKSRKLGAWPGQNGPIEWFIETEWTEEMKECVRAVERYLCDQVSKAEGEKQSRKAAAANSLKRKPE